MNDKMFTLLSKMETRGWELTVRPIDWLNPGCGWTATVRMSAENEIGYVDVTRDAGTPHGALGLLLEDLGK